MAETTKTIRKPYFWEAIIAFLSLVVIVLVTVAPWFGIEATLHFPMMFAVVISAFFMMRCGYTWKQVEKSMIDGISVALPAVLILIVVGALIAVWVMAGIVPAMIYWGLAILSPQIFFVTVLIVCSLTSMILGTSWGTAGTLGIAFIGIGIGLDIPVYMTAGAVVSGAYFGDKLSPLSDTTNMTSSVAGADLFAHIKNMIPQTVISYVLALIIFLVLGFVMAGGAADTAQVEILRNGIYTHFNVSPFLLLAPVIVMVAIGLKVPALPGILVGAVVGVIFAFIFQSGITFQGIFDAAWVPPAFVSEYPELNNLFGRGGIRAKMYAVSLIAIAMSYGGIMDKSRMLEVVVEKIIATFGKTTKSLVTTTVATTFISNVAFAEQYVGVILPTKMFARTYRQRGFHPKMLSSAVDGTGTLTSPLVPWNTCGIAMAGFLGVTAWQFAPFAFFNWMVPLVTIGLAFAGKYTRYLKDDPTTVTASYLDAFKDEPLPEVDA